MSSAGGGNCGEMGAEACFAEVIREMGKRANANKQSIE